MTSIRRNTAQLAARQRASNLDFNVRHATTIASVRARGCSAMPRVAAAAYAAADVARDNTLSRFAEAVVQILVRMGVKAAQYLDLAPLES